MTLVLFGHGYIGTAIAAELMARGIEFDWRHHQNRAPASGIVINAAGYTGHPNVDACEIHRDACRQGNLHWPRECENLADGHPVLHIGSGCIYNGPGPFTETDPPNFSGEGVGSYYSSTKAWSEAALADALGKSWLLRPRMPFGRDAHPKNLLVKLAAYPKLVDARNSLTCIEDLAKVVAFFVTQCPPFGVYNCTNPGSVTTREITKAMGFRKRSWFRSHAEFRATVVAPRSFCTLDTAKLEAVYPMRPVHEALWDCIQALNQKKAA